MAGKPVRVANNKEHTTRQKSHVYGIKKIAAFFDLNKSPGN